MQPKESRTAKELETEISSHLGKFALWRGETTEVQQVRIAAALDHDPGRWRVSKVVRLGGCGAPVKGEGGFEHP